ncbi:MAG: trypsin-like peptidase domain-containing protein, partial [Actinomycetota bacterium]|nr:trypsin-like peptidase domain-containing protein [Actinomycetota bacterium]
FCFTLLFVLSFAGVIYAQDAEEESTGNDYELTYRDKVILTEPSVCYISTYYFGYVYNPNWQEWSEQYYYGPLGGTGFCVNPDTGHIFTAGHVIDEPYDDVKWSILDAYIYDNYPDEYYELTDADWNWIFNNYEVEGENGPELDREVWVQFNSATAGVPDSPDENYVRAEVIDFSPWEQRDLAVIKIAPVTGSALSSVMIGDSSMIEIQDEITIIGYPWNADIIWESAMTPSVASGNISARKMVGGTEVLQVDMTAAPGNSGSPVLNEDGEVIGMLTMGSSENVNFLRPSNDISDMLDKNGVENKLGTLDEEFEEGLIMFRQEHYSVAIESFNAVLNLNQRHLKAQEYRAKSQEAINRGEDVPLTEEDESAADEDGEAAGEEDAEDEEDTGLAAIGITIIVLAIVLPIIFVVIIVVVIIIVVRKKNARSKEEVKEEKPAAKAEEPEKEKSGKEEVEYCPHCGKKIEKGQKFCGHCGGKL